MVKIEPEMKLLLIVENSFNGTNKSMDEINEKEEPQQDDLVSEFFNKQFYKFSLHKINMKYFLFT